MNASIHHILSAIAIMMVMLPPSADANAPAGQYVVTAGETGNGSVYDTRSKLTWQQTVSSTRYAWADAKTYCAGVESSLGGKGWRLPTAKELVTLFDFSQTNSPFLDRSAFPSTPLGSFWSSSPLAGSSSKAWIVNFYSCSNQAYSEDTSSSLYVRCVR